MAYSVNYTLIYSEIQSQAGQGIEENALQFFDCKYCSTKAIATIRKQPDGATHYAALLFQNCDRLLKWLPKPKKLSIQKLRSLLLTLILDSPRFSLTARQIQFLTSIRDAKRPSEKQLDCLDRILLEMRGSANV